MEKKQIPYSAIWAILIITLIVFGYTILASEKPRTLPDKVIVRDPDANVTVNTAPVDITVIGISDTRCTYCKDDISIIEGLVDSAPALKFNVRGVLELNQTDPRAQVLMEKYNITRLPTILINKEAGQSADFVKTWTTLLGTREADGVFVMRDLVPPFVENDSVVGLVNITIITDRSCTNCVETDLFLNTLRYDEEYGVARGSIVSVDAQSEEGLALIERYGITKTPTFIVSKEAAWYPPMLELFEITSSEDDGSYVYRNVHPPYKNLNTQEIVGLVDVIEIVNGSCADCFEPALIRESLAYPDYGFFFKFGDVRRVDIESVEGRMLDQKYDFDFVPTAILSPNANEYELFVERLGNFGTLESDGWFVFRNKKTLGNSTIQVR